MPVDMSRFTLKRFGVRSLAILLLLTLTCQSLAPVRSESWIISDPTNDFVDMYGKPTTAEAYLDIVSGRVYRSEQTWIVEISVSSKFEQYESPAEIVVEWGVGIDADMSGGTGKTYTQPGDVFWNALGIDYWAKITYDPRRPAGQKLGCSLWQVPTVGKGELVGHPKPRIIGATFEMTINSSSIGNPKDFGFLLMTQKASNVGEQWMLLAYDKAPNVESAVTPEFSLPGSVATVALLTVMVLLRRRRAVRKSPSSPTFKRTSSDSTSKAPVHA